MTETWRDLILTYAEASIDAPALKIVTLAQWALESGYGASRLARDHVNFGGLKFRARVNRGRENEPLAVPVDYLAHDGEDTYCKFASPSDFIAGYWAFVDNGPMYEGWRSYASDPSGYIGHLFRGGYAGDPGYIDKVLALVPTIRQQVDDLGLAEAFMEGEAPALARVAILVGHNAQAKGAYSALLTVSEWDYNGRVAEAMTRAAPEFGLAPRVFFRERHPRGYSAEIAAAYAAIDAWEPAVILELHFNAGGGSGTEILHWHASSRGKTLADAVGSAVLTELALPDRGSKARRGGERGSTSLKASRYPTILTEPFFGDSAADCARMLELGEAALGRAYLIGVRDALAG